MRLGIVEKEKKHKQPIDASMVFFAEKKQILIMVGQSEMFKKLKAKEGITFIWNNFKRYIILQSFPYRNKYFRSQMTKKYLKKNKNRLL